MPEHDAQNPAPDESPKQAQPATALKDRPAQPRVEQLPPFRVLLHNDDVNSFEWVIQSIIELTPHNKDKASVLALEAHMNGVSLITVTHRERAELFQDQFKSKGLSVTIEPAQQ